MAQTDAEDASAAPQVGREAGLGRNGPAGGRTGSAGYDGLRRCPSGAVLGIVGRIRECADMQSLFGLPLGADARFRATEAG